MILLNDRIQVNEQGIHRGMPTVSPPVFDLRITTVMASEQSRLMHPDLLPYSPFRKFCRRECSRIVSNGNERVAPILLIIQGFFVYLSDHASKFAAFDRIFGAFSRLFEKRPKTQKSWIRAAGGLHRLERKAGKPSSCILANAVWGGLFGVLTAGHATASAYRDSLMIRPKAGCTGRAFGRYNRCRIDSCSDETCCGCLSTIHSTSSVHGGWVSEPMKV